MPASTTASEMASAYVAAPIKLGLTNCSDQRKMAPYPRLGEQIAARQQQQQHDDEDIRPD
ncbi:hypothetical protein GCM10023067_54220 [Aminobacter aganoensis]